MNGAHINGVFKYQVVYVLQLGIKYNYFRSFAWHYVACLILDKFGLLRVHHTIEMEGMDLATCGGHAFFYEPARELDMKDY